jgi:flavin reductase (DIM6/NTAB) family NADH-FMN oxidoreductase RutF
VSNRARSTLRIAPNERRDIDYILHSPWITVTMAARKLQQEMDKTFKKVDEGVAEFQAIHQKIESSTNAAQKEKLEVHQCPLLSIIDKI